MSYDLLSNVASLPVFLPDSLLKLEVPPELMMSAIQAFNEQAQTERIELRDNGRVKARVTTLVKQGDDLFLQIRCFDNDGYRLDEWAAKMIGYVVMNKNTGAIADLVIEGFQFVRRRNLMGVSG